jgi:male-specific lethal 1
VQEKEALSEVARRSAATALFELDGAARQKTKEAAKRLLKERLAARREARASGDGASRAGGDDDADDADGDDDEHVMLSYNWGHQEEIKRINTSLKSRGYNVWIDIEKMQGSTVDAMADAVEGAAVMCYAISQAYKESANCRLEAQYAYQQQLDMVPLMMEQGYSAKGWLGMLLGVRLWYGFYGTVLESEAAFEGKVDELCRELGEKGKS